MRLNLVAAWRGGHGLHRGRARAALELTEQGTRIADAARWCTDEVWAHAVEHYDGEQLAALVSLVVLMNTVNRVNVIVQ